MHLPRAFRALARSPAYSSTAVTTVALTIALAATVFAVVDGVLFKPLPYHQPGRLYNVVGSAGASGTASLAPADVRYLAAAEPRILVTSFRSSPALTDPERPDVTIGSAAVDRNFFDVLGMQPLVGRFAAEHFERPAAEGEPRPAIVSYAFWRQWLGTETGIVGRVVDLVNTRLLIVGVLPRDFVFPTGFGWPPTDVILPSVPAVEDLRNRWSRGSTGIARVPADMPIQQAHAKLSAALASRVNEYEPRPNFFPGPYNSVEMRPLDEYLRRVERPMFRVAFIGAGLLIVLGAINVAGLFAGRTRDRQQELAIHSALGARRVALVRLMLMEVLIVAVAGGVAGLLLAVPLLTLTLRLMPPALVLLKAPSVDWRVAFFALATSTAVMTTFAVIPAIESARNAIALRLAHRATSTVRVRTWRWSLLLGAESAIGLALVISGSLVLASFIVLRSQNPGFESRGLSILEIDIPSARTAEGVWSYDTTILDRLAHVAGVQSVAAIGAPLLKGGNPGSVFAAPKGAARIMGNDIPISGAFFDVTRLRVLEGRVLTRDEIAAGRPYAVVSAGTARAYWPGGHAVGQTLSSDTTTVTIVGVVEEATLSSQNETVSSEIYLPAALTRRWRPTYLVRTSDAQVVHDAALAVKRDIPGVLVRRAESFDAALLKSVRVQLFRAVLFSVAAGTALLLVAVGIGGVVAMGVAGRMREIGIRLALGARPRSLIQMVVLEHMRPSLVGAALGIVASWWTTRLLGAFVFNVGPHNVRIWTIAVFGLSAVAAFAAWLPARRVANADPMEVLRAE